LRHLGGVKGREEGRRVRGRQKEGREEEVRRVG
jgi:hypothetical protein